MVSPLPRATSIRLIIRVAHNRIIRIARQLKRRTLRTNKYNYYVMRGRNCKRHERSLIGN